MLTFVINKNEQPSGDYEVHNASTGCSHMSNPENQINLGAHASCHGAVEEAKNRCQTRAIKLMAAIIAAILVIQANF